MRRKNTENGEPKWKVHILTPLGDNWGWGKRILEMFVIAIAVVIVRPLVLIHDGIGRILEKLLG